MSSAAVLIARQEKRKARLARQESTRSEAERQAYRTLLQEAHRAGATLANAGRGGLPPSLALGVMRRDGFTCKRCGLRGAGSGGLILHHKGGVENPVSLWLRRKGKSNTLNNLVTVCRRCHSGAHEPPVEHNPEPGE